SLDFGLWTLDFGLWTLDFGLWRIVCLDHISMCNLSMSTQYLRYTSHANLTEVLFGSEIIIIETRN
ncbi:hypothetical protein ACED30_06380, partial [Vibrio splendidus]|uniref:hypothetical protein n=2 Tax=Vibrio splendidus TaxID=29497 RepID=UPI00352DED8D